MAPPTPDDRIMRTNGPRYPLRHPTVTRVGTHTPCYRPPPIPRPTAATRSPAGECFLGLGQSVSTFINIQRISANFPTFRSKFYAFFFPFMFPHHTLFTLFPSGSCVTFSLGLVFNLFVYCSHSIPANLIMPSNTLPQNLVIYILS